ncbi:MAG TPA: indole-3-glycerol phosphate synthase TrpC [Polyangia bacterium]|nr:indole-3-glycerol phosphate synthase TrpC [Polyangia bacterium]
MILDDILRRTRGDLAARRERVPQAALEAACLTRPPARDLAAALRRPGVVSCIAEHKRRSPSAGWIREGSDAADIATAYARAGAAAISMLTDEPFFGGSLEDLRRARAVVEIPILCKDFFVDAYQVVEARAAGADAMLIIVAALLDREISILFSAAAGLGMQALVEVHDEAELERALALGATVIGVNNRDLKTFTVDRELALRLRARIPADRLVVAESGLRDASDVARLRAAGVEAMLVGESLMRAPDPGAALAALLADDGG